MSAKRLVATLFASTLLLSACADESGPVPRPSSSEAPSEAPSAAPSAAPSSAEPAPSPSASLPVVDDAAFRTQVTVVELAFSSADFDRLRSDPDLFTSLGSAVSGVTGQEFSLDLQYQPDGSVTSSYTVPRPVPAPERASLSGKVEEVLPEAAVTFEETELYRFGMYAPIPAGVDAVAVSERFDAEVRPLLTAVADAGQSGDGPFQVEYEGLLAEGASLSDVLVAFAGAVGVEPGDVELEPLTR